MSLIKCKINESQKCFHLAINKHLCVELQIYNIYLHNFIFFSGSSGVVWAIIWFLVVKNSPSEDPNISEEERLYIENALANDVQKKVQKL